MDEELTGTETQKPREGGVMCIEDVGSNYPEIAGEISQRIMISRAWDLRHVGVWTSKASSIPSLALSGALSVSAVKQMGTFGGGMTGRNGEPGGGC